MKKLLFIHGTMGVGKTTICRQLYQQLEGAVWLDGDWCWMMHPFIVSEENKQMVLDNIQFTLGNYNPVNVIKMRKALAEFGETLQEFSACHNRLKL